MHNVNDKVLNEREKLISIQLTVQCLIADSYQMFGTNGRLASSGKINKMHDIIDNINNNKKESRKKSFYSINRIKRLVNCLLSS